MTAHLPLLEKSCCCCSPIVGAAFISFSILMIAATRVTLLFFKLSAGGDYNLEDSGIYYIIVFGAKFFAGEGGFVIEPIVYVEIILNITLIVFVLFLLAGLPFGFKTTTAMLLYWMAVTNFLRGTCFMIRVMPLYYNYTASDFYAMGMGPVVLAVYAYLWFAVYTHMETIPTEEPPPKK